MISRICRTTWANLKVCSLVTSTVARYVQDSVEIHSISSNTNFLELSRKRFLLRTVSQQGRCPLSIFAKHYDLFAMLCRLSQVRRLFLGILIINLNCAFNFQELLFSSQSTMSSLQSHQRQIRTTATVPNRAIYWTIDRNKFWNIATNQSNTILVIDSVDNLSSLLDQAKNHHHLYLFL